MSNTVERIRPVNGLTRFVRLVRPVQVVKQWFTGCTGRGSMVTCISLVTLHFNSTVRPVRVVRLVRVVKQWFTSRTVGEVYIIRETYGVYTSPRLVRLVKQWFTSRTIGELHRLHTAADDKQFCRTHTTRE